MAIDWLALLGWSRQCCSICRHQVPGAALVAVAGNDASVGRGVDREEVPVDTDGHA